MKTGRIDSEPIFTLKPRERKRTGFREKKEINNSLWPKFIVTIQDNFVKEKIWNLFWLESKDFDKEEKSVIILLKKDVWRVQ